MDYSDYFAWEASGAWIRVSVRAIIFDAAKDKLLIEKNHGQQNVYFNFIGGGLEIGETFQQCIERELNEETDARLIKATYLFAVENFIQRPAGVLHALDHYIQVELDREQVTPTDKGVEFAWISLTELAGLDLRPTVSPQKPPATIYGRNTP
ncbi:MAG: NUDIX hydrolase [Chloroflexota bacterium]